MIDLAVILLVDRAGRLLLQLRDEHAPNHPGIWCLPGGHCEPGEPPATAAVRELWEETRLVADDGLHFHTRQELPDLCRVKHYFYGSTSAQPQDVVVGEGADILFLPPAEVLDGRPLTPGTAETIAGFLESPAYRHLSDGTLAPYAGDEDYPDWAYLGDRYVCDLADPHRTCHRRANLLRRQGNAATLRALVDDGHRCAFVQLMRLFVEEDRVDELRAIALAGDGRAEFTLYEYLTRHHHGETLTAALRAETAHELPRAPIWLAEHLADAGHTDEALAALTLVAADSWHAQEAQSAQYRIRNMRWTVWRQDDNGNRYTASIHTTKPSADTAAAVLETRGHKQTYGVRPTRRGDAPGTPLTADDDQ
ncbi:NUDIX domain-containing protein [Pilimelia columellifera]|uniref:Nudix hydrolase domain-containing protein n=1 Tax=Pilimelia columellifera subsp. columellifera TaxID=706583 RepID=A0ABP6AT28_9ACTN